MRKYGAAKIKLWLIALSLSACAKGLPPPPQVVQYQYNGTPRAFYGVDSVTHERIKRDAADPEMKAAQCLSADDYRKSEAYVKALIDLAAARCNFGKE